jgi:hypothetical protein
VTDFKLFRRSSLVRDGQLATGGPNLDLYTGLKTGRLLTAAFASNEEQLHPCM